jgi:hypothetical protein
MEEAYQPLALPAPHETEWAEQEATQAIQPVYHPEPTLQPTVTPNSDLSDLLAAIPSTVHIENFSFSMSQNHMVNTGPDIATIQAYVQQADEMIAELHALRNAQFTAEHEEISRFEQRVVSGC